MKYFVGLMVLILLIMHQDYWNWYNGKLVFGFLPYSIAYHCVISLAAAAGLVRGCQVLLAHPFVFRFG